MVDRLFPAPSERENAEGDRKQFSHIIHPGQRVGQLLFIARNALPLQTGRKTAEQVCYPKRTGKRKDVPFEGGRYGIPLYGMIQMNTIFRGFARPCNFFALAVAASINLVSRLLT
jgi:hypothetical protein